MAVLKVNSKDISTPSEMKVGVMDISKAERNARGTMILERIATKQKLFLTWKYLPANDLATILTAISSTFFSCTYTDPVTNKSRTATMYVGDRDLGILDVNPKTNEIRYKDVTFDFIEK